MWNDYYSWHPTIQCKKPLILSGFYGTPIAQIGRFISSLSGVNCIDCERLIEHKLNYRLSPWFEEHELEELEKDETSLLKQSLQGTPPSFILLPPHMMFHPMVQDLIKKQQVEGIIITRSRAAMWNSIQQIWHADSDRYIDIEKGSSLDEIHRYYLDWLSLCPKDWVRYPMQTETPLKIAQRIIAKMSEVPS